MQITSTPAAAPSIDFSTKPSISIDADAQACATGRRTFFSDRDTTGEIRRIAQQAAFRWHATLEHLDVQRAGNRLIATATFCGGANEARNAAKFF